MTEPKLFIRGLSIPDQKREVTELTLVFNFAHEIEAVEIKIKGSDSVIRGQVLEALSND